MKDHNALLYDYLEEPDTWFFKGPDGRFKVPLKGSFRANNGDVMLSAIRKGLGVDLVPTFFCCEDLRNGQLEVVLLDFEDDPLNALCGLSTPSPPFDKSARICQLSRRPF